MYGSVARLQVKPEAMEKLMAWGSSRPGDPIPGYVSQVVLQMDKASYVANMQSATQIARYAEMRTMLAADPEWHDGAVIYAPELAARQ